MIKINVKNKLIAILVIIILIISATGVSAVSNLTDKNNTVNKTVEFNKVVNETIGQEKTKNILSDSDDDSRYVTVRLIDTYGNILINYKKNITKSNGWTIQQNNVGNRLGQLILSENGGKVNPSTIGARYVKNGRIYTILGYNTEFPIKLKDIGENYTFDIILNVEPIDCQVTLTYVDNVTGETIRSTTNNILKGDSWIVEQAQFDNVVSNRMNITVDDRNYTFVDFNTSTPLTMEWQPKDYEVVVCLNYDEVIVPPEIDNDTIDNQTIDNQTDNETIVPVDNQTDNQTDDKPVGDTNDTKINTTNINQIVDNDSSNYDNISNNTIPVKLLNAGYDIGVFLIACILLIVGLICLRRYYS